MKMSMTLKGIDVSSYQKNLNVAAYPCDFVICEATEGTWYVNPVCDAHYQQAKASGKLLGVYHYARPDTGNSAADEADYFLGNIKGYIGEAVLALDLECAGWQNFSTWAKAWLNRVYEKTGIRPLFYSPGAGFQNFKDMLNAGNYGVWACSADSYYNGATIVMKQSVYDNLDHDTFYGDATAWRKYANPFGFVTPASPAPETSTGIGYKVGDTVRVINAITYDGKPFRTWFSRYEVMEVSGDRIVIGVNGVVTAAINASNIAHA